MPKSIKESATQTHFIEISFTCPICGKNHSLMLSEDEAFRYARERDAGKCIQDIFPSMSPSDREKFITGMCDACQKNFF